MSKMNRISRLCLYMACAGVCSLLLAWTAYADSCDNLDRNKSWVATFTKLNGALDNKDWNGALDYSKQLEDICDQSPILNYTIAYIHKNKGDNEKYLFYLQKSTQNTERFSVDKDLLDRIWSDKYVAAHPEAHPDNIAALNKNIEDLKNDLEQEKLKNSDLASTTISKERHFEEQVNIYKTPMWIAAGIGIGGLAMAGAGAALVAISDPVNANNTPSNPPKYRENLMHTSGWILVGVGSGLAISGAIFTGIFGYKYKHFNDRSEVTFNFSPSSASLAISF